MSSLSIFPLTFICPLYRSSVCQVFYLIFLYLLYPALFFSIMKTYWNKASTQRAIIKMRHWWGVCLALTCDGEFKKGGEERLLLCDEVWQLVHLTLKVWQRQELWKKTSGISHFLKHKNNCVYYHFNFRPK